MLRHLYNPEVLPEVQSEPPAFGFVPAALCSALGTAEQSLALSLLHLPFRYSPPLIQTPQFSTSGNSPQLFHPLIGLLLQFLFWYLSPLDSFQYAQFFLILGGSEWDRVLQVQHYKSICTDLCSITACALTKCTTQIQKAIDYSVQNFRSITN